MDHREVKLTFGQKVKVSLKIAGELLKDFWSKLKKLAPFIIGFGISYLIVWNIPLIQERTQDHILLGIMLTLVILGMGFILLCLLFMAFDQYFSDAKRDLISRYERLSEEEQKKSLEKVDDIILKDK